jgi:predicted dehydrogenase
MVTRFKFSFVFQVVVLLMTGPAAPSLRAATPIRVAVIGLVHDHARGLFVPISKNSNVQLVGIAEADKALAERYATQFHLDPKLFFADTDAMLDQVHPDAVLVYTSIQGHRKAIEAAASRGISSMVEKPLATTMSDALAIRKTAREHHVQVLVNYETTWYASNAEAIRLVANHRLGEVRRVVVHDGHEGPKEIGVGPEFLGWLTDPVQNGAGALFDFGCYGADLMTVLMGGATPESVTAVTLTDKPGVYPKVDDDATVIIRYKSAQAVLQPSWDWPFARKDMEVYGATGYAVTVAAGGLRTRFAHDANESQADAPPLEGSYRDSLDYLVAVLRGEIKPDGDLSSLETNMVVMQILDAARESAKTGRTVTLQSLPK